MINVIKGDITKINADVIVNAANEYLMHGGGVALAISKAGGEIINEESRKYIEKNGPLKVAEVAITSAGKMNAKYIAHVVGPRGTKPKLLGRAIENIFKKAKSLNAKSIALPAVSCGIFGFDKKTGAEIIYKVCKKHENKVNIFLVSTDNEIIKYWKEMNKK